MESTHVNTAGAMPAGSVARTEEGLESRGGEIRPGVAGDEHDRGAGRELGLDQPGVLPVAGEVQSQFADTGLVTDQSEGADVAGDPSHRVEELLGTGAVEILVVLDGRLARKRITESLPGFPGAAGRGADDVVGNVAVFAEPAAELGGIPDPARRKRSLVVGEVVRPVRLGVPEDDEPPGRVHVHRLSPRSTAPRNGGPPGARTQNLRIKSPQLY